MSDSILKAGGPIQSSFIKRFDLALNTGLEFELNDYIKGQEFSVDFYVTVNGAAAPTLGNVFFCKTDMVGNGTTVTGAFDRLAFGESATALASGLSVLKSYSNLMSVKLLVHNSFDVPVIIVVYVRSLIQLVREEE